MTYIEEMRRYLAEKQIRLDEALTHHSPRSYDGLLKLSSRGDFVPHEPDEVAAMQSSDAKIVADCRAEVEFYQKVIAEEIKRLAA